jgi:hypothetical protein
VDDVSPGTRPSDHPSVRLTVSHVVQTYLAAFARSGAGKCGRQSRDRARGSRNDSNHDSPDLHFKPSFLYMSLSWFDLNHLRSVSNIGWSVGVAAARPARILTMSFPCCAFQTHQWAGFWVAALRTAVVALKHSTVSSAHPSFART